MDLIKSQILTLGILRNTESGTLYSILAVIAIIIIQELFRILPDLVGTLKDILVSYLGRKANTIINPILKDKSASIVLERVYTEDNKVPDDMVDSVIDYISSCDTSKYLRYKNNYILNHNAEIRLIDDIYVQLVHKAEDKDKNLTHLTLELYSYTIPVTELKAFIYKISNDYIIRKQNKLGDQLYYFNEVVLPLAVDAKGVVVYSMAKKHLVFSSTKFYTSKTLDNIFGEQIALIKHRIDFFINNRKWYQDKGIPYTFGLLLHGLPGCGKTSIIKAIANITKRHIVNISLHKFITKTHLNGLFYTDKLYVGDKDQHESLIIPTDKRLYVLEDIDCMTDIIFDRKSNTLGPNPNIPISRYSTIEEPMDADSILERERDTFSRAIGDIPYGASYRDDIPYHRDDIPKETSSYGYGSSTRGSKGGKYGSYKSTGKPVCTTNCNIDSITRDNEGNNSEQLSLSFLLNLFDGVLETPGRILIITTNYPDKLDKALIRPGRIDLIVDFGKCSRDTTQSMIEHFYDVEVEDTIKEKLPANKYTPAELSQILFKHLDVPSKGIEEVINTHMV